MKTILQRRILTLLMAFATSICVEAQAPAAASRPVLNVLDFGAKNDGSANAADAFRAAIAAAKAAGGGTVLCAGRVLCVGTD